MVVKKIFVVDDEPKIIQVVSAYLEKEGCQVFTASSGKEALELNERKTPDLIILDLRQLDLSGEEDGKTSLD
jgi:DNA-binding response OmpR family regulator